MSKQVAWRADIARLTPTPGQPKPPIPHPCSSPNFPPQLRKFTPNSPLPIRFRTLVSTTILCYYSIRKAQVSHTLRLSYSLPYLNNLITSTRMDRYQPDSSTPRFRIVPLCFFAGTNMAKPMGVAAFVHLRFSRIKHISPLSKCDLTQ